MKGKIYLGTNWKMHKNSSKSKDYLRKLKANLNDISFDNFEIFVIPPYTSLNTVKNELKNSRIKFGAQNMHWEEKGAYTAEISPVMLKDYNIDLIELGHSERRQYYNENDYDLNKKLLSSYKYDYKPLVCVGEKEKEKEYDLGPEIIGLQLKTIFNNVKKEDARKAWIAYEPVWAIGEGGKPATSEYAEKIHRVIREKMTELYDKELAEDIVILYGGSVNYNNALEFINKKNIDGLFIGRAAWEADSFSEIIHLIKDNSID